MDFGKRKKILDCLLQNRNCNLLEISKFTKLHYSTIHKIFKEQKIDKWFVEKTGERPHEKNHNQMVSMYGLTSSGYGALVYPFYFKKSVDDVNRAKELKKIFKSVLKNYPSFLPELLRKLPVEYSVVFYPFFNKLALSIFKLLEAKSKEPEETEFVINNSYFQCNITLTPKELEILLPFAEGEITKEEQFHKAALNNIREKKTQIDKLRSF